MKIVYCFHSLSAHGGVEKILTLKANYMVEKFGYDVTIITYEQFGKPVFFELNKGIKLIHLDIRKYDKKSSFFARQKNFFLFKKELRKQLFQTLLSIRPDITISMGTFEFYVLNKIPDGSKKIAEYHVTIGAFEVINKNLNPLKKMLAEFSFRRFIKNIRLYDRFIVLTEGDRKEWSGFSKNVVKISNPNTFQCFSKSALTNPIAIAVGRFEPEKRFDFLIEIWASVVSKYPQWKLVLKGSGSEEDRYRTIISEKSLENNVFIEPASHSLEEFYKNASLYLMASKFEGFSLVMLEAMEAGLPIVAFNCKYGPQELVHNNENGYLINQNDEDAYLKGIISLIENIEKRKKMGSCSAVVSRNYDIDFIMGKWKELFENLKKQ